MNNEEFQKLSLRCLHRLLHNSGSYNDDLQVEIETALEPKESNTEQRIKDSLDEGSEKEDSKN